MSSGARGLDQRSLGRGLAAFRIFFGLILISNGLAKLFEFRSIEIGPYKTFLINRAEARGILDFEVNRRGGGTDVPLLPADAESNVTAALDLPESEALKVAHHGSADPGLPALLERVQPRFAAIEVGRGNTYGHPAPSTLAALRAVGHVVRTDRDGTVRLRVRGTKMTVERGGRWR